jgi:hypothetical protein
LRGPLKATLVVRHAALKSQYIRCRKSVNHKMLCKKAVENRL